MCEAAVMLSLYPPTPTATLNSTWVQVRHAAVLYFRGVRLPLPSLWQSACAGCLLSNLPTCVCVCVCVCVRACVRVCVCGKVDTEELFCIPFYVTPVQDAAPRARTHMHAHVRTRSHAARLPLSFLPRTGQTNATGNTARRTLRGSWRS